MNLKSLPRILLSVFVIAAGVVTGAVLGVQVRTPTVPRVQGPTSTYAALTVTRDELQAEQQVLRERASQLGQTLGQTQDELKAQRATRDQAETLERLQDLAGLLPQQSSGLVVTLSDGEGSENVVFGSDLRDVVNVLWEAGAQAIAINEERVVMTTAIDTLANTTLINGSQLTSPFVLTVLGPGSTLKSALGRSALLKTLRARVQSGAIVFEVQLARDLTVPAFGGTFENQYLKPEEQTS